VILTLKTIPFKELPFSNLFSDYCTDFHKFSDFFEFNPFDSDDIENKIRSTKFNRKEELASLLNEYNDLDLMHPKAISNLKSLIDEDEVYTVVTGQQLIVAGGPMFTMYKILTAIEYARRIETNFGKKVVPVFWLADEDHDFDEIARVGMPHGNEWASIELKQPDLNGKRVADIQLSDEIERFIQSLDEILVSTDFKVEVLDMLKSCYQSGGNHGKSFGSLITKLFSRFGLILAGSSRKNAQLFLNESIVSLIPKTDDIFTCLENTSAQLEKLYHRQAAVNRSNWFYVGEDGVRQKMHYDNGNWITSNVAFTTSELIENVKKSPASISPNVFMRPILQDRLLPNLAYVAGPGEVSYYAQMKELYQLCNQTMPIVVPRFSATLLEGSVKKNFEELPFRLLDYSERIEDLEARFLKEVNTFDIAYFIDSFKKDIERIAEFRQSSIEAFDKSLIGTLQKVKSDQLNLLENLRFKMLKSAKSSLEVQIKRINKVQIATFPNRNLQERELAFIYILNKYGFSVIDKLNESVIKSDFKRHHIEVL
jgi:bacillithiol biosynthesis cysteine-adding enzyme BshC